MKPSLRGFTLIEILVIIVIISIVSSAAIMSLHHNQNTRMAAFAKRLSHAFTLAETQAILQMHVLGWSYNQQAFQFYQYVDNASTTESRWQASTLKALSQQSIPSGLQLSLIIEGKTVAAATDLNTATPTLIITPSGDMTAFTLYIGKKGEKPRYQVIGLGNGKIYSAPVP